MISATCDHSRLTLTGELGKNGRSALERSEPTMARVVREANGGAARGAVCS
jgi:hypothetical protein